MASVASAGRVSVWEKGMFLAATVLGSWLGMQVVHELGHVSAAWLTGGVVARVALDPFGFSRTDLALNPRPLVVAWAGPLLGSVLPVLLMLAGSAVRLRASFVLRFFAGFCLVANGLYLGLGSFGRVGDCGDLLSHGAGSWQLRTFGAIAAASGIAFWHGQARNFGLGSSASDPGRGVVYATLGVFLGLAIVMVAVGAAASAP